MKKLLFTALIGLATTAYGLGLPTRAAVKVVQPTTQPTVPTTQTQSTVPVAASGNIMSAVAAAPVAQPAVPAVGQPALPAVGQINPAIGQPQVLQPMQQQGQLTVIGAATAAQ